MSNTETIVINNESYISKPVSYVLSIDKDNKGSFTGGETVPLLFGNVQVSYNYLGKAPTDLVFKLYANDTDLKDKSTAKRRLHSDKIGIEAIEDVFFDSITIDDNFEVDKVSVYFHGYELKKPIDAVKLELFPVVNNDIYVSSNVVVDLSSRALLGGDSAQRFKVAQAVLNDEAVTKQQMTDALPDNIFFDIVYNSDRIEVNKGGNHTGLYHSGAWFSRLNYNGGNDLNYVLNNTNLVFAGYPISSKSELSSIQLTSRHFASDNKSMRLRIIRFRRTDGSVYTSVYAGEVIADLSIPVIVDGKQVFKTFGTDDFIKVNNALIELNEGDFITPVFTQNGVGLATQTFFSPFIGMRFKRKM